MGRRRLTFLAPLAALVSWGGTGAARADTVHLTNGRSFEEVIAERIGDQVVIQMPHGEMKLPAARVARIEKSDTLFAQFLARKKALGSHATAASWLDLARWAREQGFEDGVREAARRTAEIDPTLEGLGPYMRALGFHAYDAEVGRWLTQTELMRRKGFELADGEWVPRAEAERRDQARRAEHEAKLAAARAEREVRLSRTVELLTLRELDRLARNEREREQVAATPSYGFTYYLPGYVPAAPIIVIPSDPHPRPGAPGGHTPVPAPVPEHRRHGLTFTYEALANRQPGSILPLSVDPGPGG